jgi:photosynthetic reaction center cytochrome c subunit
MKAKQIRKTILSISFIAIAAFFAVTQLADQAKVEAQEPARQPRTAGQTFKNIQVIKSMPASQLQSTMSFMAASLGVECSYCHTPPAMEKDDKPTKHTARRMLVMMNDINKNFGDKTVVNCATCHRGQTKPAAVAPLPPLMNVGLTGQAPLPGVDEILHRYIQAIGGDAALNKIKTRVRKGSVQIGNGPSGTFEIYEAAPNKQLLLGTLPAPLGSIHQGFDGAIGWVKNQNGVFEMSGDGLAQAKREGNFYADTRLKEQYTAVAVEGKDSLVNREVFVIRGTRADGTWEKLLFDVQSGLLLRRYWETSTFFGQLPSGIDYDNYKKVGSVRMPFTIRRSRPGTMLLQTVSEIKLNLPIDDSKFSKPVVESNLD